MAEPSPSPEPPKQTSTHDSYTEFKKRRQLMGQTYNKYEFTLQHLLPIREELTKKYLRQHNQYCYNILSGKIQCYQKYGHDALLYFECFDKVQTMVQTNFHKLNSECLILENKLSNCLADCSKKSKTNEIFLECSEGEKGCFSKYKNKIYKLYHNMYKVILEEPVNASKPK